MKHHLFSAAVLTAFLLDSGARAADLEVTVSGLRSDLGLVRLALFDDAGTFLKEGHGQVVAAATGDLRIRFGGLAVGTYALAVHHDEDANGELATNLLGIPVEGTGFSNDAHAWMGPPRFADAAFFLDATGAEVTIHLSY